MHIKCLEQYLAYRKPSIRVRYHYYSFIQHFCEILCEAEHWVQGGRGYWADMVLASSSFTDKQTGCHQGVRGLRKKENGVV